MEKTEFVVNFLREFIIGTDFDTIEGQLFRVLQKTSQEAESLIPEHERNISRELPSSGQELERLLGLIDEFNKNFGTFSAILSKVEDHSQEKQSDMSLNKSEDILSNKKLQFSSPEESFSSLQ